MDETSVVPGATVLVDLNGRSVLVTGAASGIGRACAERFARAGASVTVLDLNGEGARKVADEMGGKAVQADLSDYEVLGRLEIEADIVINNAGLQYVAAIEDFPPERFAMLLRVMLKAPFRLVQARSGGVAGYVREGVGRAINISSVHGLRASSFKAAYISAKHGLEGLSKVITLEGGPKGITSNCISPPYVRTPLVEGQIAGQAKTRGITE